MHSTARSVHLPNKPAATSTSCNSLPLPPTQRGAGGTDNNFGRHRPLKRIASGAVARFKHGYNVISADRVAWSTRDASRPKKPKAKRSLGQNFLQREEVLVSIVKAAGVSPGDRVLEIGPGTGALTRHLLRAGASLTAVEKDDALHAQLQQDFEQEIRDGQLMLVHNDFLSEDATALLRGPVQTPAAQTEANKDAAGPGRSRAKVVANLPYNLTKSILRRLLPLGDHINELHLMVQDEVARRLVAGPDAGLAYRAMNLEVAFYSQPEYLFEVDRTAFDPAPNVDGAVVKFVLRPKHQWPLQSDLQFLSLVRLAFAERRKMLRNTLQSRFSAEQLADAFAAADVPLSARPQQLRLDEYVSLWQQLLQTSIGT